MSATIAGQGGVIARANPRPSSAYAGALPQVNIPVLQATIDDTLSAIIASVLRISPTLVRPRWQVNDPNQPAANVDWVSIGITTRDTNGFPYVKHVKGGPSILSRWVLLTTPITVYGPNAPDNAEALRDAFYIGQNRETLDPIGIKFVEAGQVIAVPDLINVQWINRADLRVVLAMEQTRVYNILDIASSDGTITTDTGIASDWLAIDPGG